MPKKAKSTSKTTLTEAAKFYIEQHKDKDPKDLAKATGVHTNSVKAYLKTLEPVEETPEVVGDDGVVQKPNARGVSLFQTKGGATVMTVAESTAGDLDRK